MENIYTALRKEDLPIEKVDHRLIASGFPSAADDYANKKLNLHELLVGNASSTFFMRVSGNDQESEGVFDGDLLIVDRSEKIISGKRVVAIVKDNFVIAKTLKRKEGWFLSTENKKVLVSNETIIWGVVTYIIHKG